MQDYAIFPASGLVRPRIDTRAEWTDPGQQGHLVGGRQVRSIPETDQARSAHDVLARRGHSRAH